MRSKGLFVVAFVGLLTLGSTCWGEESPAETKPAFEATVTQTLLHSEAQRHRLANGRDVQQLDAECCAIAQKWAAHMASRQSMYHGGGEQIIAYGYATPASAVRVWINSPPHNGWLLSRTTRAGWGAAQSRNGTWYWAGAFRGSVVSTETTTTGGNGNGFMRRGWGFFRRR